MCFCWTASLRIYIYIYCSVVCSLQVELYKLVNLSYLDLIIIKKVYTQVCNVCNCAANQYVLWFKLHAFITRTT